MVRLACFLLSLAWSVATSAQTTRRTEVNLPLKPMDLTTACRTLAGSDPTALPAAVGHLKDQAKLGKAVVDADVARLANKLWNYHYKPAQEPLAELIRNDAISEGTRNALVLTLADMRDPDNIPRLKEIWALKNLSVLSRSYIAC